MTHTDRAVAKLQGRGTAAQYTAVAPVSVMSLLLSGLALASELPDEHELEQSNPIQISSASTVGSSITQTAEIYPIDSFGEVLLVHKMAELHEELSKNQIELDAEAQKILFDNIQNMYL